MRSLFLILYRYRGFLIFVLLELVCAWLVIRNNNYHNAAFLNSSNRITAGMLETQSDVWEYIALKDANELLARENARLRMQLQMNASLADTSGIIFESDTLLPQYFYLPAKVINNSIHQVNNFITINKGSKAGVRPGMGVISPEGVVGKVKAVSEHYATITSLLHSDVLVSSVLSRSGTFCSTTWNGRDPRVAQLRFVPRHQEVVIGDTVVTSGYNAVFPRGIMIGTISKFDKPDDAAFYNIDLKLSTDFSNLSFVYVVENQLREEKDSIELLP